MGPRVLIRGCINELCSRAKYPDFTEPLSTQEYKWVAANCKGNFTKCGEMGVACERNDAASCSVRKGKCFVASFYGNQVKV